MRNSHRLPVRQRRRDWYALGRAAALRGADFLANPFFSFEGEEHSGMVIAGFAAGSTHRMISTGRTLRESERIRNKIWTYGESNVGY